MSAIAPESVDALLPQTQCTRCGYPRCLDYARALAAGETDLNRCPPGGTVTVTALAKLLDRPPRPLAPECGDTTPRTRAVIDEDSCIGCTKCLPVCPVDAIIGGPKRMHTVIARLCTGCELCIAPCPVDCISLVRAPAPSDPWPEFSRAEAVRFRDAAARHFGRLAGGARSRQGRTTKRRDPKRDQIRKEIAAAVARVRQRRASAT